VTPANQTTRLFRGSGRGALRDAAKARRTLFGSDGLNLAPTSVSRE